MKTINNPYIFPSFHFIFHFLFHLIFHHPNIIFSQADEVTVLLYCNHGWSPKVGGELRAWAPFDQGQLAWELLEDFLDFAEFRGLIRPGPISDHRAASRAYGGLHVRGGLWWTV